jgi:ribA/ribD-fused uncharacterized protein
VINSFTGEYDFLSNFYHCPISYAGQRYPTTEHAFQALKTLDLEERSKISRAGTPGQAKRLGREVKLRKDWESVKVDIMREILHAKFTQNTDLLQRLLLTGETELIEGNTWGDREWGQVNGVGKNLLGKLLMELRRNLASGSAQ